MDDLYKVEKNKQSFSAQTTQLLLWMIRLRRLRLRTPTFRSYSANIKLGSRQPGNTQHSIVTRETAQEGSDRTDNWARVQTKPGWEKAGKTKTIC